MEVYESETRDVISHFIGHDLSFTDCLTSLDAALARFIPRLTGEHIAYLRALMLANNARVMSEMERRGPPS